MDPIVRAGFQRGIHEEVAEGQNQSVPAFLTARDHSARRKIRNAVCGYFHAKTPRRQVTHKNHFIPGALAPGREVFVFGFQSFASIRAFRSLFFVLLVPALTSCGGEHPFKPVKVERTDTESARPKAAGDQTLILSRVPYTNPSQMYRDHEKILEYLSEQLGRPVDLSQPKDYETMTRDVVDKKVHIAWLGPLSYLTTEAAVAKAGALVRLVPVVKPVRFKSAYYASQIIVRKDSGYTSIADLRGKRMAFGDVESTSGYLVAKAMMLRAGVSVDDPVWEQSKFVQKHGNVVLSVLFGKMDAGAVFKGGINVFLSGPDESRREELKVLISSDTIPNEPVAAVLFGDQGDEFAAKLREAFINVSKRPDILKTIVNVNWFETATAAEYESLRRDVALVAPTIVRDKEHHVVHP